MLWNRWSRFEIFEKLTKSGTFTKNYNGSDRMIKSNSRDRDNQRVAFLWENPNPDFCIQKQILRFFT